MSSRIETRERHDAIKAITGLSYQSTGSSSLAMNDEAMNCGSGST
jgi:hypothetical protein